MRRSACDSAADGGADDVDDGCAAEVEAATTSLTVAGATLRC